MSSFFDFVYNIISVLFSVCTPASFIKRKIPVALLVEVENKKIKVESKWV